MPIDQQRAQHFAEQWYAAWNAHDLTAILDHYADDVEMVSPLVSALTGSHGNTIAGKDALRAYFLPRQPREDHSLRRALHPAVASAYA
jgi:ketosteroid isomerase-like protein